MATMLMKLLLVRVSQHLLKVFYKIYNKVCSQSAKAHKLIFILQITKIFSEIHPIISIMTHIYATVCHILITFQIIQLISPATYQIMALNLFIPNQVFKVNTQYEQGTQNLCIQAVEVNGNASVRIEKINVNQNLIGSSSNVITGVSGSYPCLNNQIFPLTFNWSTYYVRVVPTTSNFLSFKFSYYSNSSKSIKTTLYTSSYADSAPYIFGYLFAGEVCSSDFMLKYTPPLNGVATTLSVTRKYNNGTEKTQNYTTTGYSSSQLQINLTNLSGLASWNFKVLYNTGLSYTALNPYYLQVLKVVNNVSTQSNCCMNQNLKYNNTFLKCSTEKYMDCTNLTSCTQASCATSSSCLNLNCSVASNCVYSKCVNSTSCQNSNTQNQTASVSASQSNSNGLIAGLVGGIAGGILIIVAIVVICIYCKKKKLQEQQRNYQENVQQMVSQNFFISQSMSPYKISSRQATQFDDVDCAVCLDTGCNVSLKCGHSFHYRCILDWLNRNNMCPNCRALISRREQKKNKIIPGGVSQPNPSVNSLVAMPRPM